MTLEEAYRKLSKKVKEKFINDVIELDDCYVFSVDDVDQPILVNEKEIRGLNGNKKEDREILDRVYKQISEREKK